MWKYLILVFVVDPRFYKKSPANRKEILQFKKVAYKCKWILTLTLQGYSQEARKAYERDRTEAIQADSQWKLYRYGLSLYHKGEYGWMHF